MRLYVTAEAVAEHKFCKLQENRQPVALLRAVHTGMGANKVAPDEAGGLEATILIAEGANVMLTANSWVEVARPSALPEEDGENMKVKEATFRCVATDSTRISGTENGSELAVQPPQLLLPQQQCTSDEHVGVDIIGNEDDEVLFLGFSQPAPCSLKFYSVNEVWRQKLCRGLGLRYIGHNGIATGGPDVCLTTPLSIKRIRGDGNIFYRSISHINTGSEDQHLTVSKAVVNLMRITGDVLTGDSTVDIKTYINNTPYINNSRVKQDGTWAVEVNIYAT